MAVGGSRMLANMCIYVGGPLASDALASPLDFITRGRAGPGPAPVPVWRERLRRGVGRPGGAIYGMAADRLTPGWPDWLVRMHDRVHVWSRVIDRSVNEPLARRRFLAARWLPSRSTVAMSSGGSGPERGCGANGAA